MTSPIKLCSTLSAAQCDTVCALLDAHCFTFEVTPERGRLSVAVPIPSIYDARRLLTANGFSVSIV